MQSQLQKKSSAKANNSFVKGKEKTNGITKSSTLFIQPKLTIHSSNDSYEKEADAVATAVTNNPENTITPVQKSNNAVQRKCSSCEKEEHIQKKAIADTITPVQRKSSTTSANQPIAQNSFESKLKSSKGSGSKMDAKTQRNMESSFGTNFNAVRIHTDTNAAQMNKAIHSHAFTNGNDIYFNTGKYNPSSTSGKHLLAHELTHTIQQRSASAIMPKTIQRYASYDANEQRLGVSNGWLHPQRKDLGVAEDGELAAQDISKHAWATDARIQQGEAALKANYSDVKMEKGNTTISGYPPMTGSAGTKKTLHKVKLLNRKGGGKANLIADCGTAARQILGLNRGSDKFCAIYDTSSGAKFTKLQTYHGGIITSPDLFIKDILAHHFGSSKTMSELRKEYKDLPTSGSGMTKDKFDKKYGINKYAVPNVGQAITINEPKGWNFHFAGVLLKSAKDYITAENYPGTGRNSSSWYFSIYGPASKKQSFHDAWASSTEGRSHTMVIDVPTLNRIPVLLRKAVKYKNGADILKVLKDGKKLGLTTDSLITSLAGENISLVDMLKAAKGKSFWPLLNYLRANYFSSMSLKDKKAIVIKAAKGHTSNIEEKIISAILHSSSTADYVKIVAHVEKNVSNESDDIIVESLKNQKGEFSMSKVPSNLSAAQAQELINTLLTGPTIGNDERAIMMILESLSAAKYKQVVDAITPKKLDAGLDGYWWDRFLAVTAMRYPKTENLGIQLIHKEKNDDASRLLVKWMLDKNDILPIDWIRVIEALLSGSTGDADENAILVIVGHLKSIDKHGLVNVMIGESKMDSGVDGKQWRAMVKLMKKYDWD